MLIETKCGTTFLVLVPLPCGCTVVPISDHWGILFNSTKSLMESAAVIKHNKAPMHSYWGIHFGEFPSPWD